MAILSFGVRMKTRTPYKPRTPSPTYSQGPFEFATMTSTGHIAYSIEDRGFTSPCFIWQRCSIRDDGSGRGHGYGLYTNPSGKLVPAHRYAYEAVHGYIPAGQVIDHHCRVTSCVNPAHLEIVSQAVNVRRSIATKLSERKVTEIRHLYAETGMSQQKLADRFGVSRSLISLILDTKRWEGIDTVAKGQSKRERLTPAQVAEVRALKASGLTQQVIADRYGVSRPLISLILSDKHGYRP